MKFFLTFALLAFLAFPAFSQNTLQDRFTALGESMERTIEISNARLEAFNLDAMDSGNMRTFSRFRQRYSDITHDLRESEFKLNRYIRSNDRPQYIAAERDNYERLIRDLEQLKSDYDSWLRSIR